MIELVTEISEVVVYADRAQVTRLGKVTLEPGIQTLKVPDLTYWLNPDSVRATAKGSAKVRLLGVQVQHTFYEETPVEQLHDLEVEIEALKDDLNQMEKLNERIQQTQDNLITLAEQTETYALALASGEKSIEDQLSLLDKLRNRIIKFDRDLIKNEKNRRDKERQLERLEQELDQWRSSQGREAYTAMIELDVLSAGDLSVDLIYVVSGVGWQPIYDLRFSEASDQPVMEINYLAQVSQHTGENWQNVFLTLSTARPALTSKLPELDPWYIRPMPTETPTDKRVALSLALREDTQPLGNRIDVKDEEYIADQALATVESAGATVNYRLPSTVTIPADGSPHKTTVATISIVPELDYVTAPKQVEAVYRRARGINDSPYTLLPGLANLFAEGEFVGATKIEIIPPQGIIEIFLGVEDCIKVEREFIRRDIDKRVVGARRRIFFGYEINLENLLEEQAHLTVHDQMPVPRHEDVKVKLEFADPKPISQENMNMLTWEISQEARQKRAIRFVFSVDYPQTMELVGLP
jgi:uncharacterized protein (TIGR02231 family)